MRIISNFHDYYDGVMKSNFDKDLIYLRKPKEQKIGRKLPVIGDTYRRSDMFFHVDGLTIGFCGKIYGAVRVVKPGTTWKPEASAICYDIEQVDAFVEANYKKKQIAEYYKKTFWHQYWRASWRTTSNRARFIKFFQEIEKHKDQHYDLFLDIKSPIFLIETAPKKGKCIINACLKDIEFYRVMDPYTAFQELSMFWGSMAHDNKPIPEISDEDMLQIKGFDKCSFKRQAGEKKRKGKRKKKE